jgi:hypothetical protein
VIPAILEAGYNFDFVDDDALRLARVEQGALVVGDGRYRVLVLPGVEALPAETYRKLETFARAGGGLVATRRVPGKAPGFRATEAEHAEIGAISARLFEGTRRRGRLVADEKAGLGAALGSSVTPDVGFAPAAPELGFVHRSTADADLYFLANTSNLPQRVAGSFRVARRRAEWWDPRTGQRRPAAARPGSRGGVVVDVDLPPYGSSVLVFEDGAPAAAPLVPRPLDPIDLSGGWRVSFGAGREPEVWERLRSWTEDEKTRYFSGVVRYEREVTVTEAVLGDGASVELQLGEGRPTAVEAPRFRAQLDAPLREAALVYVNGRPAGAVWCPPYTLDVTAFLHAGTNQLRIEVANLAVNHMAGRALPDYRLLNLRHGVRFEPQDMDKLAPVPAGLLGPVRLQPSATGGTQP